MWAEMVSYRDSGQLRRKSIVTWSIWAHPDQNAKHFLYISYIICLGQCRKKHCSLNGPILVSEASGSKTNVLYILLVPMWCHLRGNISYALYGHHIGKQPYYTFYGTPIWVHIKEKHKFEYVVTYTPKNKTWRSTWPTYKGLVDDWLSP